MRAFILFIVIWALVGVLLNQNQKKSVIDIDDEINETNLSPDCDRESWISYGRKLENNKLTSEIDELFKNEEIIVKSFDGKVLRTYIIKEQQK